MQVLQRVGIVALLLSALALAVSTFWPTCDTPPNAFGWKPDPEAVAKVLATLPTPEFSDTPAGKVALGELPKQAYLWQTVEKVTGKPAPIYDQNPIGSCVGFGTSRAFEKSLATQIALGDRFEWKSVVEEIVYAGSRVEVAGWRTWSDGSVGAYAAKFVQKWGAPPRAVYNVGGKSYNLTSYNPTRCREWGYYGVPDDLEPECRKFPAADITMVTTWEQAKKALAQGYGIAICSNQGFAAQRDSNGVARASGSWAHCMCLDGYHVDENTGKEYGHIENSWGTVYHRGPVGWDNPPESGFWAESGVIARMLSQRDSWAIAAVKGFPSRKIDWFAMGDKDDASDLFTVAVVPHNLKPNALRGEVADRRRFNPRQGRDGAFGCGCSGSCNQHCAGGDRCTCVARRADAASAADSCCLPAARHPVRAWR